MYKVISFGHRCSSASFIEKMNLKTESYPFDWLVSKLDVIQDCIETRFIHFLNKDNYIIKNTETFNRVDDKTTPILYEVAHINTYYETDIHNIQTYNYKLAMNHHTINNDYEYFQRCINRLYDLFESDIQKYYLYFHPIMGIHDFQKNRETILHDFDTFHQYIIGKTNNIAGIYFLLIRHSHETKSIKLKETSTCSIFVLYCNDEFLDAGPPFIGNCHEEYEEVISILKNAFR
jgi:hypothetical protein